MLPLSVLITCYREARFIGECLRSAFLQDYAGPLEYLILDDASDDDSVKEIRAAIDAFGAGRDVRLIVHETNRGIAASMDELVLEARYDHLVWMDGDDIYAPTRCSVAASLFAAHPDAMVVVSSLMNADAAGAPLSLRGYAHNVPNDRLPPTMALRDTSSRIRGLMEDEGGVHIDGYGTGMCMNRALYRLWGPLTGNDFNERCLQDATWVLRAYLSGTIVGDARIAGNYRSHSSNLYNRCCGSAQKERVAYELFWTRNREMPVATVHRHLLDIERALRQPALSSWPREELLRLRDRLEETLRGHEMCSCWWDVPWPSRLRRAWQYRGRVPANLARWPLGRLLPLRVFAWLKFGVVAPVKARLSR